jgi:RNA polymerase sigma factor (sigma-70 family)
MKASLFFLTDDAKILDLVRQGDEEALVRLYEVNRKPIFNFILHNHGTSDDAEDLLQEAVIILWERVRAGRYRHEAKLSTFIYGTVKNLWLRRLARRRRETNPGPDSENVPNTEDSPLEKLIERDELEWITRGLAMIGEQCRRLLLLFYWEERSMEEIAAEMGFANAETVKSKKYQCKKGLEQALQKLTGDVRRHHAR